MEPTRVSDETTELAGRVEIDIETAVAGIAAEIARRGDLPAHPHGVYQVVCSADRRFIWIASAVGPCMDPRFTPLEVHAERSWTWQCFDLDSDSCDVGWRTSTPAAIVDLLEEVLAGGSAPGSGALK